jgi:hypothetical protein
MNEGDWALRVAIGVLLIWLVLMTCVVVVVVVCRERRDRARDRATAVVFVPQHEFASHADYAERARRAAESVVL